MSADNYQGRENRKCYRLIFPSNRIPRIKISGKAYAIIDMSENGIRLYNPFNQHMPDDQFTAHVSFSDGEQIQVIAQVVRYEPLMVALTLIKGIPYERMLAEKTLINEILKK